MITIWTRKERVPEGAEIVEFNDAFFDLYTKDLVGTEQDLAVIKAVDNAEPAEYQPYFRTPFGVARPENFSTGCKTVLNILHHPSRIFDTVECGENAIRSLIEVDDICFVAEYLPAQLSMKYPLFIDGVTVEDSIEYERWWSARYETD